MRNPAPTRSATATPPAPGTECWSARAQRAPGRSSTSPWSRRCAGDGEGRDAAEAIARDYAEQHDHPAARAGCRAAEQPAAA